MTTTHATSWTGPLDTPEPARPGSARDLRRFAVLLGWIPVILLLDSVGRHGVSLGWQRLLGVGTWVLLLVMLRGESRRTKAQVAIVVAFASLIEYTFAGLLGVYVYRLHDVPWFVPPGHGLVYLGALTFGRTPWAQRHRTPLVVGTLVAGGGYAVWGAFVSSRFDSLGAFWFVCLALFLWWGRHNRNATVYVGAFVIVTYLELMGTGLGTWTWKLRDPILGIVAIGNPPSGAAGGYGFFDAAALLGAPGLERLIERHSPAFTRLMRRRPAGEAA
ncbi:hypothetical protein acdb102_02190 [Acidothermaceae bacterium B102]|nr:hypothetical protein acdb102_02190 [Acidothermaceae bacterium B102]